MEATLLRTVEPSSPLPDGRRREATTGAVGPLAVAVMASAVLLTAGITTGQLNWPVYATAMVLGGGIVAALHVRVGLSRLALWGLVVFGISHLAGGMVPVGDGTLYQWWPVDGVVRYDNLQHAWGFGFVGLATWEVLRPRLAPRAEDAGWVAGWVVVLGASAFGAANEILEYLLTLTLTQTNVGGYDNTARDLVANLLGGVAVGVWTARRVRRQP